MVDGTIVGNILRDADNNDAKTLFSMDSKINISNKRIIGV